MTVDELIEELKKHSGHSVVIVEHISKFVENWKDEYFINDIEVETNVGNIGNIIKIII